MYVPNRGQCLSLTEADFVYTCLEHDVRITPFEANTTVSPSPDFQMFDFDFENCFEVFDTSEDVFPFSTCTNDELKCFFHISDRHDEPVNIIVDRCYDCRPGYDNVESQPVADWSILTPVPILYFTCTRIVQR